MAQIDPRVLRPSIIIGLGGIGSKVVVGVRKKLLAQTENDPRLRADLLGNRFQFLTFDTSGEVTQSGSEASGIPHYGVQYRRSASALVSNSMQGDKAFPAWWPNDYRDPGSLIDGAGMVPINGKLCWYADLRNGPKLKDFVDTAVDRATNVLQNSNVDGSFWVFLVSSLCGGTGAGLLVPMMHEIKQWYPDSEIIGLFMLPSAVMRENIDVRNSNRIWANGAATLLSLDHWMLPREYRRSEVAPFFQIEDGMGLLPGGQAPLDAAFLFTNRNNRGLTLGSAEEYARLMADGLTEMLFSPSAVVNRRGLNNYLRGLRERQHWGGRCQRFGSYGVSTLRFPSDSVTNYLGYQMSRRLVEGFFLTPWQSNQQSADALRFIQAERLREADGANDLMEDLPRDRSDMQPLPPPDLLTDLQQAKPDELEEKILGAVEMAQYVLGAREVPTGRPALTGPTFRRKVEMNAADKRASVVSSLADTVADWLRQEDVGFAHAYRFLKDLRAQIEVHRKSIEDELYGDTSHDASKIGLISEEEQMRGQALSDAIDRLLRVFRGPALFRDGRGAKDIFVQSWWYQWLAVVRGIRIRHAILGLYEELKAQVTANTIAFEKVHDLLVDLEEDWNRHSVEVLSQRSEADLRRTAIEELVLARPEQINAVFELKRVPEEVEGIGIALNSQGRGNILSQVGRLIPLYADGKIDMADKQLAAVKEQLSGRIIGWAREQFVGEVSAISIWQALALEAGFPLPTDEEKLLTTSDRQRLCALVGQRVKDSRGRCAAFWDTDLGKVNGARPMLRALEAQDLLTYNLDAWAAFVAAYDLDANQVFGPDGADQALDVPEIHALTSVAIEGGYPINILSEAPQLMAELLTMEHGAKQSPVFTDIRLENGLPRHWEAFQDGANKPLFLLAEQLGIIESPLKKGKSNRSAYKFARLTLGKSRYEAESTLAEDHRTRQAILIALRKAWDELGRPQRQTNIDEMQTFVQTEAGDPRRATRAALERVEAALKDPVKMDFVKEDLLCVLMLDVGAVEDLTIDAIQSMLKI
jgi:hypothetical protein